MATLRIILLEILQTLILLLTPIMLLKFLQVVTNCRYPVAFSTGISMEPTLHEGNLLILSNHESVRVGDIVVFTVKDTLVCHRVIALSKVNDGGLRILTKGENNMFNDRSLYGMGKYWLNEDDIIGRVTFLVPYLGKIVLLVGEYPLVKGLLILIVACVVVRTQFRLLLELLNSN